MIILKFIAKYLVWLLVKKGVIIGVIIVVAIGIAVASVYSDQDAEIVPTQNEGENSEEQTTTEQEGRHLSIELEESMGLTSP